jgi:hypothetical protein
LKRTGFYLVRKIDLEIQSAIESPTKFRNQILVIHVPTE